MAKGLTKFIKRCAQWVPKEESSRIPPATRGIYALHQRRPGANKTAKYDVVYIGMTSRSSVGRRLARHKKDENKSWSHFSIFEVRHNFGEDELKELEGLLLEIYRKDPKANRLNKRVRYGKFQKVPIKDW